MDPKSELGLTMTQAGSPESTVLVLSVAGQIHMKNVNILEQIATEAHAGGAKRLLLDLSSAPSLTSAGLRAIVSLYRLFEPVDGGPPASPSRHLKLVVNSPHVLRTLRVAGFERYIEIFGNLPTALASFP